MNKMLNNYSNTNKTNNQLVSKLAEHTHTHINTQSTTHDVENPGNVRVNPANGLPTLSS
jgi:archaellum component FlaF (FlaF/FlaG flagellin family)